MKSGRAGRSARGKGRDGSAEAHVELSAATVELLGRYLPDQAVAILRRMPAKLREGYVTVMPSRGQARAQARRIASLARELTAALDANRFRLDLPPSHEAFTDARAVNPIELQITLEALAKRMQLWLAATSDDPAIPQISLPGRGQRSYADKRTILVGDSVIFALHSEGVKVTTGETSPAVRCVAAVFADFGFSADAREFVRRQVRQYRVIFRGGGATSPDSG